MKNSDKKERMTTRSISKKIHRSKFSRDRANHQKDHQKDQTRPEAVMNKMFSRIVVPNNFFEKEGVVTRVEEKYLSTLGERERKYIIKEICKSAEHHKIPLRIRVLQSKLPNKNKYEILQRINNSCESSKFDAWIESLLRVPLSKLAPPPVDSLSKITPFLLKTREQMDKSVYGQFQAKDEIMRLLCQWSASGGLNTFAIALEGPPGIGKTTFAKNVIANVMSRPFNFLSLGGATDAAGLVGHSYTYEGAIPGRIVECLKASKVMNPCFYFDELDKISKTPKGDEISNILVHLTDREQNNQFHDKYFNGVDFDLSHALFVFSYNNAQAINPVLLDRLSIIKLTSPCIEEKVQIAKRHLLPKAMKASALGEELNISDECIEHIIRNHTDESGVRNLEKALNRVTSTLGVLIRAPEAFTSIDISQKERPLKCNREMLDTILGKTKKEENHMCMYN